MHMKRNILIALICLINLQAHAIVVNVTGHGEIPVEGMEFTVNEAELDFLTEEWRMGIEGTLACNGELTVTITRSASGMNDEFCCAGKCRAGNEETSETQTFTPEGMVSWYVHYYPVAGSHETVTYGFDDGTETRTLIVHYDNTTQDVETVSSEQLDVNRQKILRDGILYIIKDNKTYTIL